MEKGGRDGRIFIMSELDAKKYIDRLLEVGFDPDQIPLSLRNQLTMEASEELVPCIRAANGKSVDSPEMRKLVLVARIVNGEWDAE